MITASFLGFLRIALIVIAVAYILRVLSKMSTTSKMRDQQREMERLKEELRKSKEREGKVTVEKNPTTNGEYTDFEEID